MKGAGKKKNTDSEEAAAENKSGSGDVSENDGGDGGSESIPREEEGEEDEEEEDEGQEERPKLDEGFFEIEAIRRKRVRKGQLQYLIKWRGWPETANTWEPLENLQSCSDVIDAFEESLRSGKHGRKRKRKCGAFRFQTKKKQPCLTSTSHNFTDAVTIVVDRHASSTLLNNSSLALNQLQGSNFGGESNGDANNVSTINQLNDNGVTTGLKRVYKEKEENEYDPKLSELRGTMSRSQGANSFEGDDLPNGLPNMSCTEPDQNNRCTGAKKRKSGSVKRFKQDSTSCNVLHQSSMPDVALDSSGTIARLGTVFPGVTENSSSEKHKTGELNIMKILKPISFTASVSDNVKDVLVTFMALRSDGREVMVDNRFLKAQNPLLLIDFYEQHLKYNTTS